VAISNGKDIELVVPGTDLEIILRRRGDYHAAKAKKFHEELGMALQKQVTDLGHATASVEVDEELAPAVNAHVLNMYSKSVSNETRDAIDTLRNAMLTHLQKSRKLYFMAKYVDKNKQHVLDRSEMEILEVSMFDLFSVGL
jgi:hypothetical protein